MEESVMDNEEIRKRVKDIKRLITEEKEKLENILKDLDKQLKEVQSQCKHTEREFWPDASGNNDSWHECLICGKEPI